MFSMKIQRRSLDQYSRSANSFFSSANEAESSL